LSQFFVSLQEDSKQIPVDQLGQKLLEKKGVSWNKKYRKQYGALRKYLQHHPQMFQLSPDANKVGLKEAHELLVELDSPGQALQSPPQSNGVPWNSEKNPPRPRATSAGGHWFDLNDSKVQPIKEKDIEKQFQGKESAYMLFYRKSQLKRPPEARGNPRYQIPEHLLDEMNAANTELQKKRYIDGTVPGSTSSSLQVSRGIFLNLGIETNLTLCFFFQCLNLMLQKCGLSGDNWHLRRLDWCYEAGEALSQENATLKELNVCRGDTLVITEGKLPEKGFLKIPIWWLRPSSRKKHGENAQDQVNGLTCQMEALQVSAGTASLETSHPSMELCYAGRIEIAGEASLEELKVQALTLPCCQEQVVPLPSFLRAWTVDSKRPGKLLRNNKQRLNDYKLGASMGICIEPLQKEENLGPHELLLRVQMGIPGERDYSDCRDLVWDISKECTTWALRQRVASHYCLPVEKIEIAKYFPERFEWLPISSWTQQISKRKRRKKQESLQSAPYHLRDGDIIGVKNLLLDDTKDFSTVRDDIGKEKQRQLALEKKKSRQARSVQEPFFLEEKLHTKPRKPEVALSINVGVFR
ncbi:ubiquitin carboxyl-terminal hydrolase 40-like, partial [Neopelma chrysocephalum]|uniref:ubiquitin carboxyl-terminal hydrolase 40-like n=1 Tax=Neopelma chrysocephalum TaxID=114329 RepID=UPI000FCD4C48